MHFSIIQTQFVLSDYVDQAIAQANYEKLEDNTYSGQIPNFQGVVAFGISLRVCQEELRSVLEDWILLGLKLRHPLPIVNGIDLNQEPLCEPLDTL